MLAWVLNLGFAASGSDAPPPPPPAAIPSAHGKGSKRKYKRYVVTIDRRNFIVNSAEEAVSLLEQAAALAERAALAKVDDVVARSLPEVMARQSVAAVRIRKPQIVIPDEVRQAAEKANRAIAEAYKQASAIAELRLYLALLEAQEDEEGFMLVLH